ncbi:unnamed protein product [Schistosoma turkestanicum]|nr:unnamed protein product [Schistosoma turkestanicum]
MSRTASNKSKRCKNGKRSLLNRHSTNYYRRRYANRRNHGICIRNATNLRLLGDELNFLCDRTVEFIESGETYDIIAMELAEQSVYFERVLKYHRGRRNIQLPEFVKPGFPSVLEFIRKGVTEINSENVYSIFIAAGFLLIPKLKEQCANLLKEIVTTDFSTAIDIWLNYKSFYWPELGNMAYQVILENFEDIWHTLDFEKLSANDIRQILHEDTLNCKNEKNIFHAVIQWISGDFETRIQYMLELLLCIRIGMLSSVDLDDIKKHDLIQIIPEYLELLNQWPTCLTDTNNRIVNAYGQRFITPRLPHKIVMVFGGWRDNEGPTAAVQVYNPTAKTWTLWKENNDGIQLTMNNNPWQRFILHSPTTRSNRIEQTQPQSTTTTTTSTQDTTVSIINNSTSYLSLDEMNSDRNPTELSTDNHDTMIMNNTTPHTTNLISEIPKRVFAGCVLVGTRVYVIGGYDGNFSLKSTLCYDFEVESGWYEVSCMYEKRYYVSVTYANDYIYALGGHNGEYEGRLNSAERYLLKENLWQTISSMNCIRSDAAAGELNTKIYIFGGYDGRAYLDSMEYYEPCTNQWTLINHRMNSPKSGASLIQYNHCLYIIGGNNGNHLLKTIEKYNSDENKWEIIGEMNRSRSNPSTTIIDNEIFILGGWSDESEDDILDSVECFNVINCQCHIMPSLLFPVSATCACTLNGCDLVKKYIQPSMELSTCLLDPPFGTFLLQPLTSSHRNSLSTSSRNSVYENEYVTSMYLTDQHDSNDQQTD